MADAMKILAQLQPATGFLADFYTVPGATQTTISSITVCNQSTSPTKFSIAVAIAGAADSGPGYVYFDQVIDRKETFVATIGITLTATDKVRVLSGNGLLSFNAFGVEVT